jgi:hypothetical protein
LLGEDISCQGLASYREAEGIGTVQEATEGRESSSKEVDEGERKREEAGG